MKQRITISTLKARIEYLNKLTNSPLEPYTRSDDGKLVSNIGNYHLSQAYGGYCVHKMENESGGCSTPIVYGHVPARELYDRLNAFIDGYETATRKQ